MYNLRNNDGETSCDVRMPYLLNCLTKPQEMSIVVPEIQLVAVNEISDERENLPDTETEFAAPVHENGTKFVSCILCSSIIQKI